jgi:hypothetical protein
MQVEYDYDESRKNQSQVQCQGFNVYRRNVGHWDVSNDTGRIFAIRGGPGKYYVCDSRPEDQRKPQFEAKTVGMCMAYICEELMFEIVVAGRQDFSVIEPWNLH